MSISNEVVKYAMRKDVLIVQTAGNDGSGTATAWLRVGASGHAAGEHVSPAWSNYGRQTVDVFALGVGLSSTASGQRYAADEGTSLAAPLVASVAAVLRSRYPRLSAVRVKAILLRSVTQILDTGVVSDEGTPRRVPFATLGGVGGIVNLAALRLAAASDGRLTLRRMPGTRPLAAERCRLTARPIHP